MTENVLVTRGLSKRYGSHPAVAHADITLRKGEIYGLVGRNGAGKTTIIRGAFRRYGGEGFTASTLSHGGYGGDTELLSLSHRTGESGILP